MATGIGASGAPYPVRAACSDRRPFLPWTSPNQLDEDTTAGRDRDHREAGRGDAPLRSAREKSLQALRGAIRTASKKGGPKAALSAKAVSRTESVRRLVGRLVGRGLVGGRRRGQVDLDAVQEIARHLQGLVVLGVRRHVGLRAGLLVALGFQMAAQRGFALGVGPRLQLVRHVLKHLDIGNNALGLDRFAGWREVARRGET